MIEPPPPQENLDHEDRAPLAPMACDALAPQIQGARRTGALGPVNGLLYYRYARDRPRPVQHRLGQQVLPQRSRAAGAPGGVQFNCWPGNQGAGGEGKLTTVKGWGTFFAERS